MIKSTGQSCKYLFFGDCVIRETKYETLSKNVLFYLSYVSLEINDFAGCIRYANELLSRFEGRLSQKTEFTVKQYLAEAYCMQGMTKEALKVLSDKVVTDQALEVTTNSLQLQSVDKITPQTIVMLNQIAVKYCANDILGAKDSLDQLLTSLELKLVTFSSSSDQNLPNYIVQTLVYFFLRTSKLPLKKLITFGFYRELQDGETVDET
jgi:hypothetical protein